MSEYVNWSVGEIINQHFVEADSIHTFLLEGQKIDYAITIDSVYQKILLLSVASYFENIVTNILISFADKCSNRDPRFVHFVKSKIVSRHYYTLFDWKSSNTNSFWRLFGEETQANIRKIINDSEELSQGETSFIIINRNRNEIIHRNLTTANLNLSRSDILFHYQKASHFLNFMEKQLTRKEK